MATPWWIFGALSGASSVAFGAFGAHGLKGRGIAPEKIASWQTAAHYQLIHSLAILVAEHAAPKNVWAKGLFTAGIIGFSGSIYALVLNKEARILGPVTPMGGLCLIGGWVALAFVGRGRGVVIS
ncbi:hypothetical protein CERZMDRAFT_92588 [Cercospora zeae-maydis SCOH1-5]|uniref:DUF423-domain-containing protein n=1 Tax=Cercospora zeae-maydis SCOH1-5 TaxID=717836 RepID=A0A6A6FWY8_9PEZI|nr:hypothetical protein CERZMDRAFT_92588 [Cercospora zeae-maydis SCOH1-5]